MGCSRSVKTLQNVQAVEGIVKYSPWKSNRQVPIEGGLSKTITDRILIENLRLFPYKIQYWPTITKTTLQQREDFANAMLQVIDESKIDVSCTWITNEARFHLEGFVNKQNWII